MIRLGRGIYEMHWVALGLVYRGGYGRAFYVCGHGRADLTQCTME